MDGNSMDILQERLERLKELFPEVFSEGKLDLEKFKASFTDDIHFNNERYVMNWAGKGDAFRVLQIPTTATLRPEPEKSVRFDESDHVFIEGENLEVLKVLQKSYFGKIKCILIDPPYNTGNDSFIYPDSFKENKEDYQKRIGDKDEEGFLMKEGFFRKNSKESGHYHSNWLSMMFPRLFLAKNLLREDGVIFVHIDDNEVHNLRMVMNEIFGEENFLAQFVWQRAYSPKNDARFVSNSHDYVLMYARQLGSFSIGRLERTEEANARYSNPDNDSRGAWKPSDLSVKTYTPENDYPITLPSGRIVEPPAGRCWRLSKKAFFERLHDNRIWFGTDGNSVPALKRFLTELKFEGMAPTSILLYKDVGHSQEGAQEVVKLLDSGVFDGPKPVRLIKRLLHLANPDPDSLILDFFAGSGTTAQAVLELNAEDGGNRKFILVQLPEACDPSSEAFKAGYKTIADITRERIRRVIRKVETASSRLSLLPNRQDGGSTLGFKSFRLAPSNFKVWRGDTVTEENLEAQMDIFTDPLKATCDLAAMRWELMFKSGYAVTDTAEKLDCPHGELTVIGEDLLLLLAASDMAQAVAWTLELLPTRPEIRKVITLDPLFKDNDPLKTNTALQLRDAGVGFKTL